MKPFPKVLLLIPLIYTLLLAGAVFVFYLAFIQPGMIWIDVDEHHGDHVAIGVPACVVNAGIRLVGLADVNHEIECELRRNHGHDIDFEEWKPAIAAIVRELEKYPDMTIVEIDDADNHVRIVKRNGTLRIEVDEPDGHVRIRVPETTMRAMGHMLADL